MVKFQKHFEKQLVPEWRAMYCEYKQLKKDVRKIKAHTLHIKELATGVSSSEKPLFVSKPYAYESPLLALSTLAQSRFSSDRQNRMIIHKQNEAEIYETELLGSHHEFEKNFFSRLDAQLNKINNFYKSKEDEYSNQAQQLQNQMEALIFSQKAYQLYQSDLENSPSVSRGDRELESSPSISKGEAQRAAKMLQAAFVEFYRGLRFLRNFSSLNMMAFVKILKKYDKVAGQNASPTYLRVVEQSYFATSDKIVNFMDRVEAVFTEHFAKGNRKQAMTYLRPMQQTLTHENINFVLGLFTGCSWSLLVAFVLLLVLANNGRINSVYLQPVFPVFSTLALFVLHLYMFGWNIYLWRKVRINYTFIFEFPPGAELKHQDVLLISTALTTMVILGMILHLTTTYTAEVVMHINSEMIALALFVAFLVLLFCPLNVCYRSARTAFLRCMWRIFSSPFFKVVFADFFLADQLTSQVPALRNLGYISCYYGGGFFRNKRSSACTNSNLFGLFQYLISVLPYWWRLMQCWRRWMDEHDKAHIANGGKYLSALIAVVVRLTYARVHSQVWLVTFVASSFIATIYQLYWDIVVDWGLLQRKSVNPWLRDQLILKTKSLYFLSMVANVILRLAWIYSVTHISNKGIEHMIIDFIFASLEVIRRGHWNFYRLENEHLNNVGKYRAVRAVPLPFKDMDDSDA